jgi:molecular chaperone DnaJ
MTAQPQREWLDVDYYKALGVSQTATEKEITKAYRRLAKENHPDSHPGREERFKEISSAYTVLSDAEKRKSYDDVRKAGPGAFGGFGGGGFSGGGGFGGGATQGDINDLLGGLFNRGGGGQRKRGAPGPRRGDDLESSLNLSFEDAVNGVTTTVTLMGTGPCSTCNATGAAPGTTPIVCSACGGRGVVDANQGFFSFSQPCNMCNGHGMRVERPCPSCNGSGGEQKARDVKVRIPAGVEHGQRIRLKQRGGMGVNGGPPGDLYVVVRVKEHTLFGRRGKDLTITVPIRFTEASLGATISVPTLDGPVSLKVPVGTKSGRTLRVKGRGTAAAGGAGDLLVTLEIAMPPDLSDAQRAAIEALRDAEETLGWNPRSNLGV